MKIYFNNAEMVGVVGLRGLGFVEFLVARFWRRESVAVRFLGCGGCLSLAIFWGHPTMAVLAVVIR